MATKVDNLSGTSKSSFFINKNGVLLKNSTGDLVLRNFGDTADSTITTSQLLNSGDSIVINSDSTSAAADWRLNFARATSGMTADLTLTMPVDGGSNGQVLITDGSGVLSWTTIATTASVSTDVTDFTFADTFPLACFTLPADAIVTKVDIITDTAYDDTAATVSVGVSGDASKFGGTSVFDVTGATGDVWTTEEVIGVATVGSTQAIQLACSAGSSTAGAGRVIVSYSIPA